MRKEYLPQYPTEIAVLLLLVGWLLGLPVKNISPVLGGIFLFALTRKHEKWICVRENFLAGITPIFIFCFLVLLSAYQIARAWLGSHGVDFVIFTQALDNISSHGKPLTSMIGLEWTNFLSHHFSPFLYLFSPLSYSGLPAYILLPSVQAVSFAVALLALFAFARASKLPNLIGLFIVLGVCVHPTIRQSLSWSIHDEVIALGLIAWTFYFLLQHRPLNVALCVIGLFLFKETFFPFAVSVGIAGLLLERHSHNAALSRKVYLSLIVIGIVLSLSYFILLPHFLPSTFSASDRIASVSSWSFAMIVDKLTWAFLILLPTFALGLFSVRGRIILLACLPFWGAILISGFSEMWKFTNYYSVSTVVASYFALTCWIEERPQFLHSISRVIPLVIFLALSIGMQVRPLKTVWSLRTANVQKPYSLNIFPPGSRVIVSEFDALVLPQDVTPLRLWTANRLPTQWDYILESRTSHEEVAQNLRANREPCWKNDMWSVLCASQAQLQRLNKSIVPELVKHNH